MMVRRLGSERKREGRAPQVVEEFLNERKNDSEFKTIANLAEISLPTAVRSCETVILFFKP